MRFRQDSRALRAGAWLLVCAGAAGIAAGGVGLLTAAESGALAGLQYEDSSIYSEWEGTLRAKVWTACENGALTPAEKQNMTEEGFYFSVTDGDTGEVVLTNAETEQEQAFLGQETITRAPESYPVMSDCVVFVPGEDGGFEVCQTAQLAPNTDLSQWWDYGTPLYLARSGDETYPILNAVWSAGNQCRVTVDDNQPQPLVVPMEITLPLEDLYVEDESGRYWSAAEFLKLNGGQTDSPSPEAVLNGYELFFDSDGAHGLDFAYQLRDGEDADTVTLISDESAAVLNCLYGDYDPCNVSTEQIGQYLVMRTGVDESSCPMYGAIYDRWIQGWQRTKPAILTMALGGGALLLGALWLIYASGHKYQTEGIHLRPFDRMYAELRLAAEGIGTVVLFTAAMLFLKAYGVAYSCWLWDGYFPEALPLWCGCVCGTVVLLALLWGNGILALSARAKAGALRSGWCMGMLLRGLCDHTSLVMRVLLGGLLFLIINAIFWSGGMLFLTTAVVMGLMIWWGIGFRRIQKGVERLNAGENGAQVDARNLPRDLNRVGRQLNVLSEGVRRAVERQMQSERFKAELITNVSHDLKTPLTSIINYVDLLKQTDITDPKALEYLEVLDRKSQRLKKLTEDLVEASKASTGALKVERVSLDLVQLTRQALGEYEDKLTSAGLTAVIQCREEPLYVTADGRHLWRVLDNLLNNCVKYAQPGTRVYLDIVRTPQGGCLTVKNISAQPLNIPPERLMERFVRGDAARTGEGSGLGLNIAHNLTELQGGAFRLEIDGDLFKVSVMLPPANAPEE